RYITQKPELGEYKAKLLGSYTSVSDGDVGPLVAGMANLPIGSTAAVRVVGLYREDPGYIDDNSVGRNLKDVNRTRQNAERALAAWVPNDKLTINATYVRQVSNAADRPLADQPKELERDDTPQSSPHELEISLANLSARYDFGWASLLSSTNNLRKSFTGKSSIERVFGLENQTALSAQDGSKGDINGWLQEFRLASPDTLKDWRWLAGASYLRDKQDGYTYIEGPIPPGIPTPPGIPPEDLILLRGITDAVATEKALFGEITRTLFDKLELTVGARYFDTDLRNNQTAEGILVYSSGQYSSTDKFDTGENGVNPKFSIRYQWSPNISTYALAAKGFQFGGAQIAPQSASAGGDAIRTFKSSSLWNYEVGARTEWFQRRLQFDATLFYMDWKDLQVEQLASGLYAYVDNVGKARSQGAEVSMVLHPVRGLSFTSAASWIDAKTGVDFENADGPVPKGTRLPGSARFQIANILAYNHTVFGDRWIAGASLSQAYVGQRYNDLSHDASLPGYQTYDARLHLTATDIALKPDFGLSLINIGDERGIAAISGKPNARYGDYFFVQPRTLIASVTLQFE
ncbi:MAG: TonB-dependent receptor, partial [Solimonas sp.]